MGTGFFVCGLSWATIFLASLTDTPTFFAKAGLCPAARIMRACFADLNGTAYFPFARHLPAALHLAGVGHPLQGLNGAAFLAGALAIMTFFPNIVLSPLLRLH